MLTKTANKYISNIKLIKDGIEVDAKSILSVMMLGADKGSKITVRAEGKDEKQGLDEICSLIERGFDEE